MGRWPVSLSVNSPKARDCRLISRHAISCPTASQTTPVITGMASITRIVRVIVGIHPPPKTNFSQMPAPNPAMIATINPLRSHRIYRLPAADVPVANNLLTPMLLIGSIGSSKHGHLRAFYPRPRRAGIGMDRAPGAALSAIAEQRKAREALTGQRQREGAALADLNTERAALSAKGRQIETEAAPIRYVAELIGADTDSEQAIRWLIALMVLCCDPLAIALTAAASARR
jgi:hypothetical protein